MDNKKFAFIICANNGQQLAECIYYIDKLDVPKGYEKDVITIQEASSMAEGYNAGMESSDAKYKLYLHQDVLLTNQFLLKDVLNIFEENEDIGMIGVVGARKIPVNAIALNAWDAGNVYHNGIPMYHRFDDDEIKKYTEVETVDGLFMATQVDYRWREDIFNGWDYYDMSQCMEFKKRNKKIVVPHQNKDWYYHNNKSSNLKDFDKYRKKFIEEYTGYIYDENTSQLNVEYIEVKLQAKKIIGQLIDEGKIEEVCNIFEDKNNRGYLILKEYEILSQIYKLEKSKKSKLEFWNKGMNSKELLEKLNALLYKVKRIEFRVDEVGTLVHNIEQEYSQEAITLVVKQYCKNSVEILERIECKY